MAKDNKVIGVGFHKTGTSTLGSVLQELGYNVLGARTDLASHLLNNDIESVFAVADEYEAFQDNPWPLLFKEFDKRYPNCKFILTLRNEDKWINSAVNHFGEKHTEMRRWIYGIGHPLGNEQLYLKKYKNHNTEVQNYFTGREHDLLIVDWEDKSEWKTICEFLNEPVPNKAFPHLNEGDYRKATKKKQTSNLVKKAIRIFKSNQNSV
jgi:hypothetical protein